MWGREYAVATAEKFSSANVKGLDDIMSKVVATSAARQEAVNALKRVRAVRCLGTVRLTWSIVSYYYYHMMMYLFHYYYQHIVQYMLKQSGHNPLFGRRPV
jgi:hypothetical protein